MAVRFIEGLQHLNSAKYAVVDIQDLYLDEDNPRFASSALLANQEEITQSAIINYLVQYGEVLSLAESIDENHGLFNETIISGYICDNKIVVLEGNRRITACKILLDNDLVRQDLKDMHPIPTVHMETQTNIKQINIIIYGDSDDAQKYIASKHTQPDVMKWTTIEQYNYYYTQFLSGKKPKEIAAEVGLKDVKKVEDKIRQYLLFKRIFDLVKIENHNLKVETTSILPVVSEFMPKLLGKKSDYALGLEVDLTSLEYVVLPSQVELYNKILLEVGKAFFLRPEAKKNSELMDRPKNNNYRISTDEIKGKNKVTMLIEDDIRIPGLKALIREFRHDDDNLDSEPNSTNPVTNIKSPNTKESAQVSSAPLVNGNLLPHTEDGDTFGEKKQADCGQAAPPKADVKTTQKEFTQKERQVSFFADLRIEHIDPTKPENQGLLAVAKEIREISRAQNYSAYANFPIASTFLLRSLIEQVLARQLKKGATYERLRGKTNKPTLELGTMVSEILHQYNNKNYIDFNEDRALAQDFNACFNGLGTKDQLDKVIHRPAECQPDKSFLDNLAKQGLKDLMQKFIDSFD